MTTYAYLWQYFAELYLELQTFQTKIVEKIKTHILYSINILPKIVQLWDNV